jgi:hypothetical protein
MIPARTRPARSASTEAPHIDCGDFCGWRKTLAEAAGPTVGGEEGPRGFRTRQAYISRTDTQGESPRTPVIFQLKTETPPSRRPPRSGSQVRTRPLGVTSADSPDPSAGGSAVGWRERGGEARNDSRGAADVDEGQPRRAGGGERTHAGSRVRARSFLPARHRTARSAGRPWAHGEGQDGPSAPPIPEAGRAQTRARHPAGGGVPGSIERR